MFFNFIWTKDDGMRNLLLLGALALLALACDDDGSTTNPGEGGEGEGVAEDALYAFGSRFDEGRSSVSYTGQIHRHLLINDLESEIGALTSAIDDGSMVPAPGDVRDRLLFYFDFDGEVGGALQHTVTTSPPAEQATYGEVSSKDLRGKLAGNDEVGQHVEWNDGGLVGWTADHVATPTDLVLRWFDQLDELAVARANGELATDPSGAPITKLHVTAEGQDIQQLLQKFLLGAIAFSQAADDYLDDDTDGSGLLSDNVERDGEGKPFTALEHAWDEGFGYFGAARDYGLYTDDEIAGEGGRDGWASGYHDTDGDGDIDLTQEFNWGHSLNAAKRDRGAVVETDFSGGAWKGFVRGRTLIAEAGGALDDDQLAALRAARDDVLSNWERAIAATCVHYINDVLQDMGAGDAYDFYDHAKHWSELKGFALGLQFNRMSPLAAADFATLHDLIGQAPALPGSEGFDAYAEALLTARTLLGAAYGLDPANLGDENGQGGW